MNRIVGLETEYGCLTQDPSGPIPAIGHVRNWVLNDDRYGLADLHQRDWDEPAGNGGFLFNGGRLYLDMGHLEYCTPECLSLKDVIKYDQAGDRLLLKAIQDLNLQEQVSFIRNNIDHYSGATFGCHENYLIRRSAPLTESNVLSLLSFLTLRVLYTGAGRIGSSPGVELRDEYSNTGLTNRFQISQRADYINNDLFEWVQFNRAIINTRDEPLADARRYRRLHLLHGDTSVLPATLALKVGTTSLVLDLLEIDHMPKLVLSDAVATFRQLSHQPDESWFVTLVTGKTVSAIELLYQYVDVAAAEFSGRDAETDAILQLWREALDGLATNPHSQIGRIDWITKKWLFDQFVEREGLDWDDPWLKSQDIEFHNTDPLRSLGLALAKTPGDWAVEEPDLEKAILEAPADTRAHTRSRVMQILKSKPMHYHIDWERVDIEDSQSLGLANPFETTSVETERWISDLQRISNSELPDSSLL